jgi:hypothetical protein
VGVVRVWSDAEVEPALGAIVDYFGTYSERGAIRIVVGDDEVGYFDRSDVVRYGLESRGFGDSGRATLPGIPIGAVTFVASGAPAPRSSDTPGLVEMWCPVENCPENPVYVAISMYYADDPLMCEVHRDTALEVHIRS